MLFIVTYGVFDNEKNDDVIQRISARGILTTMVMIADENDYKYYAKHYGEDNMRHKAEVFGCVKNGSDLLPFAKQIVTGAVKKRIGA